jgi:NAD+ kinase
MEHIGCIEQLAVVCNPRKPETAQLAQAVLRELALAGLRAFLAEPEQPEALAGCGALIAVGGDGTILQAARLALPWGLPVLGVNAGRVGFLAGLEPDELGQLPRLAQGDFALDERMLLEAQVLENGQVIAAARCVNDAVVARHSTTRATELSVACAGRVLRYLGDGVIFSTPTGSTAYNFSAGGPVADPAVESILVTPVCNHALFSRTVLFAGTAQLQMEIAHPGLALTCDAEPPLPLLPGQCVRVCRAAQKARFIRLKENHFLDILNAKLMLRGDAS